MKSQKNRLLEVTLPYTIGFMVASISYTRGINPFITFVVGETVALFSAMLVRFLIKL
ncbi:MAG TPA: hypothetical protein V6D37_08780 [Candidatus Sericytochromatia bacterium]